MLERALIISSCSRQLQSPFCRSHALPVFTAVNWFSSSTFCSTSITFKMEKKESQIKPVVTVMNRSQSSEHRKEHTKGANPSKDKYKEREVSVEARDINEVNLDKSSSHYRPHCHHHPQQYQSSSSHHHPQQHQFSNKLSREDTQLKCDVVQLVRSGQHEIKKHRVRSVISGMIDTIKEDTVITRHHQTMESNNQKELNKQHRKKRSRKDSGTESEKRYKLTRSISFQEPPSRTTKNVPFSGKSSTESEKSYKLSRNNFTEEIPSTARNNVSGKREGKVIKQNKVPQKACNDLLVTKDSVKTYTDRETFMTPIVEQLFKRPTTKISMCPSNPGTAHSSSTIEQLRLKSAHSSQISDNYHKFNETDSNDKTLRISEKSKNSELEEEERIVYDSINRSRAISKKHEKQNKSKPRKDDAYSSESLFSKLLVQQPESFASEKTTLVSRGASFRQESHQKSSELNYLTDTKKTENHRDANKTSPQKVSEKGKAQRDSSNKKIEPLIVEQQKSAPVSCLSQAIQHGLIVDDCNALKEAGVSSVSNRHFRDHSPLNIVMDDSHFNSDMSMSSEDASGTEESHYIEYSDSNFLVLLNNCNAGSKPGTFPASCAIAQNNQDDRAGKVQETGDGKLGQSASYSKNVSSHLQTLPYSCNSDIASFPISRASFCLDVKHSSFSAATKEFTPQIHSSEMDSHISTWAAMSQPQHRSTAFVSSCNSMGSEGNPKYMMTHTSAGMINRLFQPGLSYSSILEQSFVSQTYKQPSCHASTSPSLSSSSKLILVRDREVSGNRGDLASQLCSAREFSSKSSKKTVKSDVCDKYCSEMLSTPRCWHTVKQLKADKHSCSLEFTVMSYNILAQNLLCEHPYLYTKCKEEDLEWANRCAALIKQISTHNADIVCLQEVQEDHWFTDMKNALEKHGYHSVYKKKIGFKTDGCVVLFKTDKFKLLEAVTFDFMKGGILDRDNIGIVVLLQPLPGAYGGKVQKICVSTTHLLFNPKRGDIKLAQLMVLLAEIDKYAYIGESAVGAGDKEGSDTETSARSSEDNSVFSKTHSRKVEASNEVWDTQDTICKIGNQLSASSVASEKPVGSIHTTPQYCPIILCGDFNSEPFSELYRFITTGYLRYAGQIARLLCGQKEGRFGGTDREISRHLLPKHLAIGERCQYLNVVDERQKMKGWSVQQPKHNSGEIFHSMNFRSTYSHFVDRPGPQVREVSTHHNKCSCTVDYIFYSSGMSGCNSQWETSIPHNISSIPSTSIGHVNSKYYPAAVSSIVNEALDNEDVYKNSSIVGGFKEPSTCHANTANLVHDDEQLQLLARYRLMTTNEVGRTGSTPNSVFPSDHLCLIARFLLR